MEFRASAEVYVQAYPALRKTNSRVEPFLNAAFAASSLATLECKLRYVPIVMPEDRQADYPERSQLRKKQRIYDCAPVLDYDVFVNGTFEDQLREYLRGIALSAPHLSGLGASPEQVSEFKAILERASRSLAERDEYRGKPT